VECCRLQKTGTKGLADAWEGRVRDHLNNEIVQRHVNGFAVPMEDQLLVLSREIKSMLEEF
jgi:hypothetical protein